MIGLAKKVKDVKSVKSNLTIEDRKSKGILKLVMKPAGVRWLLKLFGH